MSSFNMYHRGDALVLRSGREERAALAVYQQLKQTFDDENAINEVWEDMNAPRCQSLKAAIEVLYGALLLQVRACRGRWSNDKERLCFAVARANAVLSSFSYELSKTRPDWRSEFCDESWESFTVPHSDYRCFERRALGMHESSKIFSPPAQFALIAFVPPLEPLPPAATRLIARAHRSRKVSKVDAEIIGDRHRRSATVPRERRHPAFYTPY
jgi:hypothetical protein